MVDVALKSLWRNVLFRVLILVNFVAKGVEKVCVEQVQISRVHAHMPIEELADIRVGKWHVAEVHVTHGWARPPLVEWRFLAGV